MAITQVPAAWRIPSNSTAASSWCTSIPLNAKRRSISTAATGSRWSCGMKYPYGGPAVYCAMMSRPAW